MAFKTLFMAHAPDADYKTHTSTIDTGKYRLFTVIVNGQEEAVEVAKTLYEKEGIEAIMLCPGFSHLDVAEIFNVLGGKVSVNVARGDVASSRLVQPVIKREFYDKK